jgi:hypothetical protein
MGARNQGRLVERPSVTTELQLQLLRQREGPTPRETSRLTVGSKLSSTIATGIYIAIGNSEVLLAAVCKFPNRTWCDTDITELLEFRNKCNFTGDLNTKYPIWNRAKNFCNCWMLMILKSPHHSTPLITPLQEMVMC